MKHSGILISLGQLSPGRKLPGGERLEGTATGKRPENE